jgi:hypothetical protein
VRRVVVLVCEDIRTADEVDWCNVHGASDAMADGEKVWDRVGV